MNFLKKLWYYAGEAFLALCVMVFFQTFFTFAIGTAATLFLPEVGTLGTLGLSLALSSAATIAVLMGVPAFGLRKAFSRGAGCRWSAALCGGVGALLGAFGCDLLNEACSLELPADYEQMFMAVSGSVWGVAALAVLGPVSEELVFRGGVMRPLLRKGVRPWVAIGVSAVLFGLVHGNLAQGFFAMLLGVLFGILYYRTGSLLLSTLCHVVNNSVSVVLMLVYEERAADMRLSDLLGGASAARVVMVACLVLCVALTILFWRKTTTAPAPSC